MSTTRDICVLAMKDIGALAAGEDPSPDDLADVYKQGQLMFASWSNKSLMIAGRVHKSFAVTTVGSAMSYTIGPGGVLNTDRPQAIHDARIAIESYDHPVRLVNDKIWSGIEYKVSQAIPLNAYYNNTYPLGTLYFDSGTEPSQIIKLITEDPLAELPALSSDIEYPPGYEFVLYTNLAVRIASMFELKASQQTQNDAVLSMRDLRKANYKPVSSRTDKALRRGGYFDIRSGSNL